jgi:hypothetical protein
MTMPVNEGSKAWLTVSFYDRTGVLAAPTTLTYQIYCLTTDTVVRVATALGIDTQIDIPLTAEDNAIINQANGSEIKRVTLIAVYGAGDEIKAQYDYVVNNLSAV